ncbi:MAG TPA: zinc ribbon domain-containing protein [Streptosporangiaceae bacterium]|nr:zinc ribbon domain-containing protein [Streptosporangiaceae bacterium]
MIICKECGNSAESADGFCSSCGALLEWSGQPVDLAAGGARGRPALAARQPVAELGRPGPVPLVTEPAHTGPYCSACGVRNPAGRTFCRSCGAALRPGAAAGEPARGWWRRLMARLRGRRPYEAGDRPRGFVAHDETPGTRASSARPGPDAVQRIRRARPSPRLALARFAPVILVAGLLGIGLGPARAWLTSHVLGLEHKAQAQLAQRYANVVPIRARVSSAAPGHGGMLAIDGIDQTYWLTGGDGTGATLRIRFASPTDIARVGVLSGEPGGGYTTQARPRTIELIAAGRPPVTLSFLDSPAFQNRPVSLAGVTVVTVVIENAYPGQQGQAVALREIEFFTRVSGS